LEIQFGVAVYKEKFNFCAAHFLLFGDGTREELHGHNYRVSVEVDGPINEEDVVIDFMILKPMVKKLCDELDHRMLIPGNSAFLKIEEKDNAIWVTHDEDLFVFPSRDVILIPLPNTSTERIAEYMCAKLRVELQEHLPECRIDRIRVSVEESSGQCGYYEQRTANRE